MNMIEGSGSSVSGGLGTPSRSSHRGRRLPQTYRFLGSAIASLVSRDGAVLTAFLAARSVSHSAGACIYTRPSRRRPPASLFFLTSHGLVIGSHSSSFKLFYGDIQRRASASSL